MPELSSPLTRDARARLRLRAIETLVEHKARLDLELRHQLQVLSVEDVRFGHRDYISDELALALSESPGTAQRWVENAQMFTSFPAVMARVGLPLSQGGWSVRHADALLDTISGLGLTTEQQVQVIDLVLGAADARTPHQIRQAARAAVMVLDPEAAAKRWDKARRERRVGIEQHEPGGAATLYATGTSSQIAAAMASLDALAGPKQPGDPRSLDQRRFDAFMDLICGRVQPASWQAVVIVSLATLTGDDAPAEIPGLGLISAPEARDVLQQASLRRAVVDENGQLLSVDAHVHTPDLPTQPASRPGCGHNHQPEPDDLLRAEDLLDPSELDSDEPPTVADRNWLQQQLSHRADTGAEPTLPDPAALPDTGETIDDEVTRLTGHLETQIRAFLSTHALTGAFTTGRTHRPGADHARLDRFEIPARRHGPPDGAGQGDDLPRPPDADPEPPPDDADLLWHDLHLDRERLDALDTRWLHETHLDAHPGADPSAPRPRQHRGSTPPTCEYQHCPAGCPPTTTPQRPRTWSLPRLTNTYQRLVTDPIDTRPLATDRYAVPPRMARFLKTRDVTCTFPGCPRLARDCQSDHVIPWPQGPTAERNLSSECTHHHQAKHHYFTVNRDSTGTLTWHTPLGRSYPRRPRPLLRGW